MGNKFWKFNRNTQATRFAYNVEQWEILGEGVSDEAELVQGESHCQEEAAASFSFQPCSRSGDISTHTRTGAGDTLKAGKAASCQEDLCFHSFRRPFRRI